ncbi:MAG: DUF5946 family protein [Candidatus Levyibacteriota bacterium]
MTPLVAFHELSYYTLSHKTEEFIHQYIIDAFAAQTADEKTKPVKINFGLIGLYLHLEKGYSGKQVQLAHMQLTKYKKFLPVIVLPKNRGDITVLEVLKEPEGLARDEKIEEWMLEVWQAYASEHKKIADFLQKYLLK